MEMIIQWAITVVCAALASSGFWAFIQKRSDRMDIKTELLLGLGHDRIVYLGMKYLERGWCTQDEFENLYEYLYKPYEKNGGNGSAKRVMDEVKKIPIHNYDFILELERKNHEKN